MNVRQSINKSIALAILVIIVFLIIISSGVKAATTSGYMSTSNIASPPSWRNIHDGTYIASGQINDLNGDSNPDVSRSYSQELQAADPLYLEGCRSDMDMFNNALWYGNGTLIFRTTADYPANPYRQIEIQINNTAYCASRGYKIWTVEGAPSNMTVNDSKCGYGINTANSTGGRVTCAPTNWTLLANATYQWLVKVNAGPGQTWEHNVIVACWNEPYNPPFFEDNTTALQRQIDIIAGCKEWQAELRRLSPNTKTMSPSFTTGMTCCQNGEDMFKNFTSQTTGSDRFDYYDLHLYQYNGLFSYATYNNIFVNAMSLATNYSVQDRLVTTETLWENTSGNIGATGDAYSTMTTAVMMNAVANGWKIIAPYRWSCGGNSTGNSDCATVYNTMIENTYSLTLRPPYQVINLTMPATHNMDGATIHNFTMANSSTVVYFYQRDNNYGRLYVGNVNNATMSIDNLTLGSLNIVSVTNFYNASSQRINVNDSINLSAIPAFGTTWYEVTIASSCSDYVGTPVFVNSLGVGRYVSNSSCTTSGVDPGNGKKCGRTGACV